VLERAAIPQFDDQRFTIAFRGDRAPDARLISSIEGESIEIPDVVFFSAHTRQCPDAPAFRRDGRALHDRLRDPVLPHARQGISRRRIGRTDVDGAVAGELGAVRFPLP